jgi:pimeloyl-ACP methyl ester carboxylesterase
VELEGAILAGGFVRHPARWWVQLGERVCGGLPLAWVTRMLFGYSKVARFRFRNNPETLASVEEFIARRTELDRQAAKHRLRLIAQNDPGDIARATRVPVYGITGLIDPVVPWIPVRKWLRTNCPSLREYRVVARADHNVLSTGVGAAAEQILKWVRQPPVTT